jgi:nucleotide-binding universal stress UspA family protein
MLTVKNVLVATDFSEASNSAVVFARQLARAFGSRLHVLHVVGSVVAGAIGVEGYTTDFAALQREVEAAARRHLDAVITDEDRRTLAAQAIVLTSTAAAQSIVSYAKDAHVDLVIVGTHGGGGTSPQLLGSVAERVVRMAACPVLVVKHPVEVSSIEDASQVAAHAR